MTHEVPARISVSHVSKSFQGKNGLVHALSDVSLDIAASEVVCLVGPSGCGKSTLLDMMAGLSFPGSGRISVDGKLVQWPSATRGMMFQDAALFPWLDALGNVLFGLKLQEKLSKTERLDIAHHYLKMVGLTGFEHAYAHQLSGGMRQRVALARALGPDPKILLMDEPFSALDAMTRERLYDDIHRIWSETHKTIVFVTHNVREAVCLGSRIAVFAPRPGRITGVFDVPLERPRDINSIALAEHAAKVGAMLKANETEKVAA